MNIAFRVDASRYIGTGHLMRCLALASGIRQQGGEISFVSRHIHDDLRKIITDGGYKFKKIPHIPAESCNQYGYSRWLGASQASDAEATRQCLSDKAWDWLIVDHYALDVQWELSMHGCAERIMVIDDIANRNHDCDILLDQNLHENMQKRYLYRVPSACRLLLGPNYALLGSEFQKLHSKVMLRRFPVKRILIFFGGVDADNCTMVAIKALAAINIHNLQVDAVIGSSHPARDEIIAACLHYQFICHIQTDRMAELMMSADLSIGAGGSASWERCCVGLPALLISLADNQVDIAKALDAAGACIYLGSAQTVNDESIKKAVMSLLSNEVILSEMSAKAYSLVDGFGVNRILKELYS